MILTQVGQLKILGKHNVSGFFLTYLHLFISSNDWKKEAGVGELISD